METTSEGLAISSSSQPVTVVHSVEGVDRLLDFTTDKYYLCDAAYTHTRGFMAPYRNVRYWLSDFHSGGRPTTKEELFNHAHAKLRNVIERSFDVLKARFPIMKRMAPYPFQAQD